MHNLLETCTSDARGGLEIYFRNFSNFSKKYFNTFILTRENNPLIDEISCEKKFEIKGKISKIFPYQNAKKVAKLIDKNDIDIIHIHYVKDIVLMSLAKKLSKKKPKLVYTRHMVMTSSKRDLFHRFYYREIDLFLAVSTIVNDCLIKYVNSAKDKTLTIFPGCKEEEINSNKIIKFKKEQNIDRFSIVVVGRILEKKGQHLAIEAINILNDLDIKLYIIGGVQDKIYKKSLDDRISELKLEKKVIFINFINHVEKYLNAFDILSLTTYKETFGMVLPEAMLAKTAVIGSDCGGPLDIIDDKKSGLLFESKNPVDLASKIKKLYNNRDLIDNLVKHGYDKAKSQFAYDAQFKKVSQALNKLI